MPSERAHHASARTIASDCPWPPVRNCWGRCCSTNKYRAHLPLNRQSDIYANEGIELGVSTPADWVGAATATLMPLVNEIEKRVLAADRIHTDDTTVPVLAEGTCMTGRLWTYVRDDAPFAGEAAPAALFDYSPTRGAEHPEKHLAGYSELMQADAYVGYKNLYARPPS